MPTMKDILIAIFVALISLFMAGYSVHMIIGGSVSTSLEHEIIAAVLVIIIGLLVFMAIDLTKRKRGD